MFILISNDDFVFITDHRWKEIEVIGNWLFNMFDVYGNTSGKLQLFSFHVKNCIFAYESTWNLNIVQEMESDFCAGRNMFLSRWMTNLGGICFNHYLHHSKTLDNGNENCSLYSAEIFISWLNVYTIRYRMLLSFYLIIS